MTTLHFRESIGRSLSWRYGFVLIPLALAWFALSPTAPAVLPSPTPDGGYPNFNTAEGTNALFSLTIGSYNTAIGDSALYHNTDGTENTATGAQALSFNTTGYDNTAIGVDALYTNTIGNDNTATGTDALSHNTTGYNNTANGSTALWSNTTGLQNTATGCIALYSNTTGTNNTATGFSALYNNTRADGNTANGYQALLRNTTGSRNTATGAQALYHNNGNFNTANGWRALTSNTTGSNNLANGWQALLSNTIGYQNTANGNGALYGNTTGGANTALGINAGNNLTTGNGNVCIGANVGGVAGESNTTRIRNVYSSVASARAVYINSDDKIGTLVSSRRFKDEIKPMDKTSEAILALKPVSFRYKKEFDPDRTPMFGLIAEEVEQADPALVTRNDKGEVETVRYDAVNAMLLNEFLKEHKKVEKLESVVASLAATVKEQASQIQKVSAQLELNKPAPQTVLNQ